MTDLPNTSTCNLLLTCAYELLLKKGMDGFSVNDIVKEANLSKGAFYYNFKNKSDIVNRLFDFILNQLTLLIEAYIEKDKNNNKLGVFTRAYIQSVFHEVRRENYIIGIPFIINSGEGLVKKWDFWMHSMLKQYAEENCSALTLARLSADGVWFNFSLLNKTIVQDIDQIEEALLALALTQCESGS